MSEGSLEVEQVAQELNRVGEGMKALERRLSEIDKVIARLEQAALTTGRAMAEISKHWDAVYEAMRREESREDGA